MAHNRYDLRTLTDMLEGRPLEAYKSSRDECSISGAVRILESAYGVHSAADALRLIKKLEADINYIANTPKPAPALDPCLTIFKADEVNRVKMLESMAKAAAGTMVPITPLPSLAPKPASIVPVVTEQSKLLLLK